MRLLIKLFILCLARAVSAQPELPPLHHVVDIEASDSIRIPGTFPLNSNNRIDCKTCHTIKDIEKIPFNDVDRHAADFFRQGPYQKLSDFCYRCHESKNQQRNNIHILLNASGELMEEKCTYCHLEVLDTAKDYQRDEIKLRLPSQKLCIGCHLKTPHLNAINHLLEVDDKMLEHINQAELEHRVTLPLDGKKILCTTCHATHENGVLDETRPAGRQVQDREIKRGIGYVDHSWNKVFMADKKSRIDQLANDTGNNLVLVYRRLTHEVLLRLPARDGTLCLVCHKF